MYPQKICMYIIFSSVMTANRAVTCSNFEKNLDFFPAWWGLKWKFLGRNSVFPENMYKK